MSGREVRLTLSEAEAEHLAGMGVVADPHGFLRSADGQEVTAGTAAQMLKSSRDPSTGRFSPAQFNRGYLDAGHAAAGAQVWTSDIPDQLASVRPQDFRRQYLGDGHQAEEAFSAVPGPVSRGPLAGSGISPLQAGPIDPHTGAPVPGGPVSSMDEAESSRGIAAKDITPGDFRRSYLTAGHQAEQAHGIGGVPFVQQGTGQRPDASDGLHREDVDPQDVDQGDGDTGELADCTETAAAKGTIPRPRPIVADQFRRAWIPGQERRPPGDDGDNNPWPAATPAALVYAEAAAGYQAGRDQDRMDHVEMTGRAVAPMAPGGWAPPGDVVQAPVINPGAASGCAPGETRAL